MTIRYLFIILAIYCLVSCGGNNGYEQYIGENCIDTLYLPEKDNFKASEYVRQIKYFPLHNSDRHILSAVSKMSVSDSMIFVSNMKQGKLCAYKLNGDFLYEIHAVGRSSKEYYEIRSFCVDDKSVHILDNAKHLLISYSKVDGTYQQTRHLEHVAWDIESYGNEHFIFSYNDNNSSDAITAVPSSGVWITDKDLKTTGYQMMIDTKEDMIGKQNYFTKHLDKIIYHDYKHYGYYIFNPNDVLPKFVSVQVSNPIPPEMLTNYDEVSNGDYQYLTETPFVTDEYVALAVGTGKYEEAAVASLKDGVIHFFPENNSHNYMPFPNAVFDEKFIYYLNDYNFYNTLTNDGFISVDVETEELLKRGGAVLLIYDMRL